MWLYLVAALLLCDFASTTTCYDGNGLIDPLFEVCDTAIPVSACCHQADFCMTNGLCQSAGGNNLLGVQGCTDKDWGTPCKKYCTATDAQYSVNVFPCPATPGHDIVWCCGPNSTDCCNKGSAFTIPVGKLFLRDSQLPNKTSTSSASPVSPASTGNLPSTTPSNGLSTSTSSSTASLSPSKDKSLIIGLGVGIPLGVIVTALLAFFSWELRRYNNTQAQRNPSVQTAPMPPSSVQVQELKMGRPVELRAPHGSELPGEEWNQIYELPQTQRMSRHR